MALDFVSVHKNVKRELGQYPAILTSRLVNNAYIELSMKIFRDWSIYISGTAKKLSKRGEIDFDGMLLTENL